MNRVLSLSLLVIIIAAFSPDLSAQNKAEADSTNEFQQAKQMWMPMFGKMMGTMFESVLDVISKPENVQKLAAFMKNYYDALVDQGFTKEEAFKIITSSGIPMLNFYK